MKVVYENALLIMKNMNLTQNQRRWAIIVAWLHDVADHKYDLDGTIMNNVILFIEKIEPTPNYIIECIKAVSFSTEKRMGYKHYENTLPPEWVIVRNIASDADKMEALGKMGVVRCIQYAQEQYEKKSEKNCILSNEEQIQYVWNHSQEKILHLHKLYIHTEFGKLLAKPLHDYVVNWLQTQGISKNLLKIYK